MIPLGKPIPNSDHAVSVSLPTWQDIIGYEEGNPATISAMTSGYPRFRLTNAVVALCDHYNSAANGESLFVFPSEQIAEKCIRFVGQGRTRRTEDGVCLAIVPNEYQALAKAFWQHSGLIVSSRQAQDILSGNPANQNHVQKSKIKGLLAYHAGLEADDVYLFPTGMAAIFTAYETVTQNGQNGKTVQLGFPYVDTLKIQQKFGEGSVYLPYNSIKDLENLENILKTGGVSAVFCEIPGNPLLHTVNLQVLREILDKYGVPLVIDDTIGTSINVDLTPYADIIVTSLTKSFSGVGDVMGGSMILNRNSQFYNEFKGRLIVSHEDVLYAADADILAQNATGYERRVQASNTNAEIIADYLQDHPAIKSVHYPKTTDREAYDAIRKPGAGYGGLLSFVAKDSAQAPKIFDRLQVYKGPSLGTNYTLACPYTLLAHFNERGFAEENGIDYNLIRMSVGTENSRDLLMRLQRSMG